MLNRFIGEANITFNDGSREVRRVIILSPYIQSSNSLENIDYDNSLVVDLQTMEFDFKVQLEDMLQNHELKSYHTFIEYAHKTVFRNGENVLAWLHRMNQIRKLPASEVSLVFGQGGNIQKMSLVDLNAEIRANNERKLNEQRGYQSSYTDPSMNESNIQPATIEKSGNQYKEPVQQNINESVEAPLTQHEQNNIDLSKVPGVQILEGDPSMASNDYAVTSPDTQDSPVASSPEPVAAAEPEVQAVSLGEQVSKAELDDLKSSLSSLENLVKRRTKDTLVTRLIDKYNLTEAEVTKAIESAGKRKEKKEAKNQEKGSE